MKLLTPFITEKSTSNMTCTAVVCTGKIWNFFNFVDTYVKLLFTIENKLLKTKKTAAVKKSNDPKYNESFHFRLPQKCLNTASILLQITVAGGPQKGLISFLYFNFPETAGIPVFLH